MLVRLHHFVMLLCAVLYGAMICQCAMVVIVVHLLSRQFRADCYTDSVHCCSAHATTGFRFCCDCLLTKCSDVRQYQYIIHSSQDNSYTDRLHAARRTTDQLQAARSNAMRR
jgi:hypothetical protein